MRKCIIFTICLLLSASLLAACGSDEQTVSHKASVDWNMTAHHFSTDGSIVNSFSIKVQGEITDNEKTETMAYLFLDIDLTKDFRYSFADPGDNGWPAWDGTELKEGDSNDLRTAVFTYDAETNSSSDCQLLINAKLGYFVAYWPEGNCYLVAAKDPTVQASDVIAHFEAYFDVWNVNTSNP